MDAPAVDSPSAAPRDSAGSTAAESPCLPEKGSPVCTATTATL